MNNCICIDNELFFVCVILVQLLNLHSYLSKKLMHGSSDRQPEDDAFLSSNQFRLSIHTYFINYITY